MKIQFLSIPAAALCASLVMGLAHNHSKAEDAPEGDTQHITLKPDATGMRFDITEFTVTAGKPVRITLDNNSPVPLPHNLVIIKPGTLQKIGAMANAMLTDPQAMAKQYIPESDDVLFHTSLVNPTQKEDLDFVAPEEPGDYPFVCTFPGHWMIMQGVMKVAAAE